MRAFGLFSCGSWLCIRWESAAPVGGSINVCQCLTQGFRPGLCRSAALSGLTLPFFFVCPQGFILGFALISPWSIREYHPCRAYIAFCFVCPQGFILGFALISPWAMQEYRPCRVISVSDTKPQSISMHQHIRTNECPTTAIQSDNNPSHHQPSTNSFGFIHYMGMGEPFRAILLQSPGWRECQRHEQNPGYTQIKAD